MSYIRKCSAIELLNSIEDNAIDLIYTDPPFGTQTEQTLNHKQDGKIIYSVSYSDRHDDYLVWLKQHILELKRVLKETGTMYLHLDWHWVHYAKVICDEVFGKENFLNEIIWSYNFGGRGKNCWPKKHDTILVYTKQNGNHVFNWDKIDRIPYAAPEMQRVGRTKEEAEKRIAEGQVPTDVWSISIVGTNSKERVNYPNQKPIKLISRVILASSNPDDVVLDPFAGSGSTGYTAHLLNRRFIMADVSDNSIETMKDRFKDINVDWRI